MSSYKINKKKLLISLIFVIFILNVSKLLAESKIIAPGVTANSLNMVLTPDQATISQKAIEPNVDNLNKNEKSKLAYIVDGLGNIKHPITGKVVGNTFLGDTINADGSFTNINGNKIYPADSIKDDKDYTFNNDGSVTDPDGRVLFLDGRQVDKDGTIHYIDGAIKYNDGTYVDSFGLVHYQDGTTLYPDGTKILKDGTIEDKNKKEEKKTEVTAGEWRAGLNGAVQFVKVDKMRQASLAKNEWIYTKGQSDNYSWFLIDSNSNMVVGWAKKDNEYYFLSNIESHIGELIFGTANIDGTTYQFDTKTGALKGNIKPPAQKVNVIGATNHIAGIDGYWIETNGKKRFMTYQLSTDKIVEVPATGWFMIDCNYYYLDSTGAPVTGIVKDNDITYYMNDDGTMLEGGEVKTNGITYVFDKATGALRLSYIG